MRAVILHGTDADSSANWFPWLRDQLSSGLGWDVWVPDLPGADAPDLRRYVPYLREHAPWEFDRDVVLIGHSSGALAALGLLQSLDPRAKVRMAVLVGAFEDDLGWPELSGLFVEPYDFPALRGRAERYVLFHSDTDPYCPLEHAEHLAEHLDGALRVEPGQGHFSASTEPPYTEFPKLLELLRSLAAE